MTTRIHTVRELVVALQGEDQDALVVATWEGILRAITVYHARSSWTRTAGTTDLTADELGVVQRALDEGETDWLSLTSMLASSVLLVGSCLRAMRGVVDLAFLNHRPRDPRLLVRARLAGR